MVTLWCWAEESGERGGGDESDSATFHLDDSNLKSLGSIVVGFGCIWGWDWVDKCLLTWSLVVGSG